MSKYNVKSGYKLTKFDQIFSRMMASYPNISQSNLNELRKELNFFFNKAKCMGVTYTKNDKMFFGMRVYPILNADETFEIMMGTDDMKIEKYHIEIDSKLFDIGLTSREFTAVLLHEVGHIVLSDVPIKSVRATIDDYVSKNDDTIDLKNSAQYTQILAFGIKDIIVKSASMFYLKDEEVKADSFVLLCGYGEELESAENKVLNNAFGLSDTFRGDNSKLSVLIWTLSLYKDVKMKRIPALHTLRDAKSYTSSQLTKQEIDNVMKSLEKINTDVVMEGAQVLNEARKGLIGRIKTSGLKAMEEDLYSFSIRAKTMNDENDALYLMRQINARISILDDTLEDDSLSDTDRERWAKLDADYRELRSSVVNKNFHKKHYGLFYDFEDLDTEQKKNTQYTYGY